MTTTPAIARDPDSPTIRNDLFTRADWERLPEGFPATLLNGMFLREPAPTYGHQTYVQRCFQHLLDAAPDRVLFAPADVVVDDYTVLQPDAFVLPEGTRIDDPAAPETTPILVLEVLSPSTASRDRKPKTEAYLRAGVAEVWLVDPASRTVEVVTGDGCRTHGADERAESAALAGFTLAWTDVERRQESD